MIIFCRAPLASGSRRLGILIELLILMELDNDNNKLSNGRRAPVCHP